MTEPLKGRIVNNKNLHPFGELVCIYTLHVLITPTKVIELNYKDVSFIYPILQEKR